MSLHLIQYVLQNCRPSARAIRLAACHAIAGAAVFSPAELTDDQLHAMWAACVEMARQPGARPACRFLADRLSRIIGAPILLFRREVSPWRLVASSAAPGTERIQEAEAPPLDLLDDLVTGPEAGFTLPAAAGEAQWTPIPLDEEMPSQALLLLPGDWRSGRVADWLPRFARTASMALRLVVARQNARQCENLAGTTFSFARMIAGITAERDLHQVIVDTAANAVGARLGSLAVYQPREQAITIAATHGYPSDAVGHVRILPGSGIIGSIFATRKPLLVRDTRRVPGHTPRSRRYKTPSFMAVPIVSQDEALGVLTLADRHDGRPFTRRDLAAARLISTVSSLALVRQQLSRLADELSHTAAVDSLTGMFNRRYLQTRLVAELERSRRTAVPVALMMLDVDTFKGINDQFGHQAGDAVLRRVSDIIRRSMRASDVCTRYGGDEFSIIVAEHASSATQTAERIRQRVEAFRWDTMGIPQALHVTVSIGVAISEPGESADSLLGRADQNLYQAKARGRNCVHPPEL